MAVPPDEDLIRHATALRGLARSLVGAQDADDLVQDAALQALRRAPRPMTSWSAWFGNVLRRRAARHHRSRFRRERREQQVAAAAAVSGSTPLATAAHRETIARLDAALLALPEPYLGTLLQRYYAGLTPVEIAARAGVPVATVKSRLQRGLGLLRDRLDEERHDWRAGLAAAFGLDLGGALVAPGFSAVATATAAGLLSMTKWWCGAAAVMLAALLWWATAVVPPATASFGETSGSGLAASDRAAKGPTESAADAPQAALARETAEPPATKSPAAGELPVTFVGRCVDDSGAPLAAVELTAATRRRDGGHRLATDQRRTPASGEFELRLPVAEAAYQEIVVRASDRCEVSGSFQSRQPGERVELGDVVIPRAGHLTCRVVDGRGVPQPGVKLRLRIMPVAAAWLLRPTIRDWDETDAEGRCFGGERLPPGRYRLRVTNRKLVDRPAAEFVLTTATPAADVELVVEPAPEPCRGVVVDEAGRPIAGAEVSLDDDRERSDTEGRFAVVPSPGGEGDTRVLTATAAGFRDARAAWQPGQTEPVRVVLVAAPVLVVRVVDARNGAPVTRFQLHLGQARAWQTEPLVAMGEHDRGICRAPVDAGAWWLRVSAGDPELAPSAFLPVQVADGRENEILVELGPWVTRRLVVMAGARPVAGARVQLVDSGDEPLRFDTETVAFADCSMSGMRLANLLQEGVTDAAGALVLRGPRGPLALRLSGGGLALQLVQPIRLDVLGELRIAARAGASWRGRLVPDSIAQQLWNRARPRPNAASRPFGITLHGADGQDLLRYTEAPFPFAADGSFAIDNLPAGTWWVSVVAGSRYAATKIDLAAGEQLHQDVDVQAMAPADVTLQFRVDGAPAAATHVNVMGWHARDAFGRRFGSQSAGATDQLGRFQLETYRGDLVAHLYWQAGDRKALLMTTVALPQAGPQQHLVELRLGALELQLLDAAGAPASRWPLQLAAVGGQELTEATTDDQGRVGFATWVAGSYEVRARPADLRTQEQQTAAAMVSGSEQTRQAWLPLGTIEVAPGPARRHEVRLPATR